MRCSEVERGGERWSEVQMADLQLRRRVLDPGRRPQPKVGTPVLLGSERWRVQGPGEGSWC